MIIRNPHFAKFCDYFSLTQTKMVRLFSFGGAFLLYALYSTGCSALESSFLDPHGPIALAQKDHLINVTLITLIAVIPVLILVPLMIWRYRFSNKKATYKPNWEFYLPLDIIMWALPISIIVVLSYFLYFSTMKLDPYKPIASKEPPLNVQVVGLDWKWLFIYPDLNIATVGELAVPVNRPVTLKLTSDTVMQSFYIGALAGQIYTMAGMTTQLNFIADREGVFEGENTQYNGTGFTDQKFKTLGLSPEKFEKWVETVRKDGIALDAKTYAQLTARSTKKQAFAQMGTAQMPENILFFNSVEPDQFKKILMRYHDGKPLTQRTQPGGALHNPMIEINKTVGGSDGNE